MSNRDTLRRLLHSSTWPPVVEELRADARLRLTKADSTEELEHAARDAVALERLFDSLEQHANREAAEREPRQVSTLA
mgnify:CR=1 FL=1